MHSQLLSDCEGSQPQRGSRLLKIGAAGAGVSCVLLLVLTAGYLSAPTWPDGVSTSLFGLPAASLRTPLAAQGPRPVLPSALGSPLGPSFAASLPGPSPWKELALVAMEGAQSCTRDVSAQAQTQNRLQEVVASMDSGSRALATQATSEAINRVKDMAGITPPLGFFDPVGFSADCSEGKLLFYREVELKHGRICMLAFLGILISEKLHPIFPNIDMPAIFVNFQVTEIQQFWPALAAAVAIPEFMSIKYYDDSAELAKDSGVGYGLTMKTDRVPGDLGYDPLKLKPKDPKAFKEMQTKEILNGRLAMIAVTGMVAQELATQQKIFN